MGRKKKNDDTKVQRLVDMDIAKEKLVKLIIENDYNITKVAAVLGLTKQAVMHRMKKRGIRIKKTLEFFET